MYFVLIVVFIVGLICVMLILLVVVVVGCVVVDGVLLGLDGICVNVGKVVLVRS